MTMYKVTIHEHKIYDAFIEAPTQQLAIEEAENQIVGEENAKWREDYNAGWAEVGEVELVEEEDYA
jgi:hypothetical protein